ncbi:MAG: hypothetical protein ABIP89_24530 [Polyangiaceae bacterium]
MDPRNVTRGLGLAALALIGAVAGARFFAHDEQAKPAVGAAAPVRGEAPIAEVDHAKLASPESAQAAIPSPAPAAASVDPVVAMREALAWPDDAARIEAVETAMNNGAVETLPALEAADLRADPEGAPTIILAVAHLGAMTTGEDSRRAERTLGRWLNEESVRDGADARGNVSVLVDALGEIGGADAVDALVAALDAHQIPLHVQTLAVDNLTQLGDRRAAGAVARFLARVNALPPPVEEIDGELRDEAIASANVASQRFSL